jgi:predicted  nucleic acid-binding Zn-ribbon protein
VHPKHFNDFLNYHFVFKASKLNRAVEGLKSELSATNDQNKKQTDELQYLQEQIVGLKVEQATLQEKCRLASDEVIV